MSVSETLYSPAIATAQELERARTQSVTLPVYRNGELAIPSAGTYTLFRPGQGSDATAAGKIVDAAAAIITAGVAVYSVADSLLPATLTLGEGYREEWALTFGGLVSVFERPASLIRKRLYPVISDQDLEARYRELRIFKTQSNEFGSTYQSFIDEAWTIIKGRLLIEGWLPYLIRTPQSLRDIHVHLALHLIFMDFYSGLDGATKYLDLADRHEKLYELAWSRAEFGVDADHSGSQDTPEGFAAAQRPLYPNGGQATRYYPRFGLKSVR